jgi:hypothetical protein
MNKPLPKLLLPLLLMFAAVQAVAQDAGKPAKIFSSDDIIAASLEGPWRSIARQKEADKAWPGTFRYRAEDGSEITIPVSITTRGLTRKRVCDFPPLRLDFDKEAAKGTAFRGAGSLKLVTHCFNSERYERYPVKEYLGYRLYNLVTDMSFRVQGLDISYKEGPDDDKPQQRFAFLIEDPDDVAERHGLLKVTVEETSPARLDAMQTSRYMLFQYLIGNLDWSVLGGPAGANCCHNARLIGAGPQATALYPVPYDLDSSGLVDAHYARPADSLPVRNVRQRLFRGFCAHNDALPAALEEFRQLRGPIMDLAGTQPQLEEKERERAVKYLQGFYSDLEDEKDLKRKLIDNCRG